MATLDPIRVDIVSVSQSMNRPLVYLACPYSGTDDEKLERFEAANLAASFLMSQGLHIFSPISHTHPIAMAGDLPGDFAYWESYDRAVLSCCHMIIVLMIPGWRSSRGVLVETRIAKEQGLTIVYMDRQQNMSFLPRRTGP